MAEKESIVLYALRRFLVQSYLYLNGIQSMVCS